VSSLVSERLSFLAFLIHTGTGALSIGSMTERATVSFDYNTKKIFAGDGANPLLSKKKGHPGKIDSLKTFAAIS
jgi:hypothetical protein